MHKSKLTQSVLIALLVITFGYSQSKKRTKKEVFTVNKDVTLNINTSHADVEFDTWNKNKVEITATIEVEDATDEEMEAYMKKWNFKAIGNSEKVTVTSKGSRSLLSGNGQFVFADPVIVEQIEIPTIIENFPVIEPVPDLPIMVLESLDDIKFDYEAFEKDGEAYMKKWQKQWKNSFDEEKFKEGMEKWQKSFEKQQDKLIELQGQILEKVEKREKKEKTEKKEKKEKQEKIMFLNGTAKEYQEKLAQIEELVKISGDVKKYKLKELLKEKNELLELLEATENGQFLKLNGNLNFNINTNDDNVFFISSGNKRLKVKKTIKIKMPKKAKLNMNVRHGELKIGSVIHNLRGDISHSVLLANHIDGSETSINVAYSPVEITTWSLGQLNLKYVEDAHIQNVNRLILNSNSSDILLSNIFDNAIIDGSFGDLTISNIADSFSNLNIILENSDALISLPKNDYSVFFKGNRSKLNNEITSQKTIENYPNGKSSSKAIVVNAKFSDVILR